jgi:hypothetical protein
MKRKTIIRNSFIFKSKGLMNIHNFTNYLENSADGQESRTVVSDFWILVEENELRLQNLDRPIPIEHFFLAGLQQFSLLAFSWVEMG